MTDQLTNEQIDAILAEWQGWHISPAGSKADLRWHPNVEGWHPAIAVKKWHPSECIEQAMECLEKTGKVWEVGRVRYADGELYYLCRIEDTPFGKEFSARDKLSPARAICLAVKEAVGNG